LIGQVSQPIVALAPLLARTGPATFTATGLAGGLGDDPQTGVISGTPTATSAATATVTMTDLAGSATAPVATRIAAAPPPPPPPPPPVARLCPHASVTQCTGPQPAADAVI